jgi:hypothetical protein
MEYQDQSGSVQNTELYGYSFYRVNGSQDVEVNMAETGDAEMETIVVYDIESVFVQDKETWKIAKTKKGDILNGAYFKYANVGQDQV